MTKETQAQPIQPGVLVVDGSAPEALQAGGYRKLAMQKYKKVVGGLEVNVCVMCGFGIPAVLEVAHLNHDRKKWTLDDLAVLCPNCHKMHDIGLIPTDVIKAMRDHTAQPDWKIRMKDAGPKAAETRKLKALAAKKSAAAKKAWATRKSTGEGLT